MFTPFLYENTSIFYNLLSFADILVVILPMLLAVAFMTLLERKILASTQRRLRTGYCWSLWNLTTIRRCPALHIGNMFKWGKLPNSGELLKLIIPNYIWKFICGWTNHSGMVTSYKIDENQMEYRGSKSAIIAVKEQRVDGNWYIQIYVSKVYSNGVRKNLSIQ